MRNVCCRPSRVDPRLSCSLTHSLFARRVSTADLHAYRSRYNSVTSTMSYTVPWRKYSKDSHSSKLPPVEATQFDGVHTTMDPLEPEPTPPTNTRVGLGTPSTDYDSKKGPLGASYMSRGTPVR